MDEGNRVSDRGGEREQHLGGEESKENRRTGGEGRGMHGYKSG